MKKNINTGSKNLIDVTSKKRARRYQEHQNSPRAIIESRLDSIKISPKQRETASKLGLSGSLAGLQNQANKAQAKRRTRVSSGLVFDRALSKYAPRKKK